MLMNVHLVLMIAMKMLCVRTLHLRTYAYVIQAIEVMEEFVKVALKQYFRIEFANIVLSETRTMKNLKQ